MFIETALEGGVLTIVLNDPARRNAMGAGMRDELATTLDRVNADGSVRALVVRGAGGNFCSGGDLTAMPPENMATARDRLAQVACLVRQLCGFTRPTLAVVEGAAAGLGASLALACDYVYMADDARLMFPFSRLGLLPDGGILHSLAARIGVSKARQLLLEGRTVGPEECLRLGLADYCYPPDQLAKEAAASAGNLATLSPLSVAGVKRALAGGLPSLEDAFVFEHRDQPACYFSSDFAEGKRAFAQRGVPVFTGF
ncbi:MULTISPECIES: enoyl-CoA hydratase/isomerase family protein [unclassified Arthrobacter]|uniref:enoyl-CoA hydratase/isomerase family protein n=1 Tax=unclassified Arthrobacter TaxID=235627 RepID=UPI002E07634F|nr:MULTISPECIES: enoyl-CoA hydratase-related protein [unclassified Arthrobacter]MEC5193256.1 2-(1,2-epoxy-1,2-dihydrophenyl)acetyl-CoA isomerase [Arthrobacter sp. MP_M4]MEC5204722.1 2-(1,2-epoxy-1,2-dihydrophenyl)acetyl-CoA isomerase [Arthrobacter sp. MP_M7]